MVEQNIHPPHSGGSPCKYLNQVEYEIHLKPEGWVQRIIGVPDDENSLIKGVYVKGANGIPEDYEFFPRFPHKIEEICNANNVVLDGPTFNNRLTHFSRIYKLVNPSFYETERHFVKDVLGTVESVGKANLEIWSLYDELCKEEDERHADILADLRTSKGQV